MWFFKKGRSAGRPARKRDANVLQSAGS
jgi:hypothetical protein